MRIRNTSSLKNRYARWKIISVKGRNALGTQERLIRNIKIFRRVRILDRELFSFFFIKKKCRCVFRGDSKWSFHAVMIFPVSIWIPAFKKYKLIIRNIYRERSYPIVCVMNYILQLIYFLILGIAYFHVNGRSLKSWNWKRWP